MLVGGWRESTTPMWMPLKLSTAIRFRLLRLNPCKDLFPMNRESFGAVMPQSDLISFQADDVAIVTSWLIVKASPPTVRERMSYASTALREFSWPRI